LGLLMTEEEGRVFVVKIIQLGLLITKEVGRESIVRR
jgi:hypothetical protein